MKLASYNVPLLLAISLSLSNPCDSPKPKEVEKEVVEKIYEVRAAYPQFKDSARVVTGKGRYAAGERATVKAEFGGVVEKVNVNEGDQIKVGDVLCLIKSDDLDHQIDLKQAELKEAEAKLEMHRKELEKIQAPSNPTENQDQGFIDEENPNADEDSHVTDNYKVNTPPEGQTAPAPVPEDPQSQVAVDEANVERISLELKDLEDKLKKLAVAAPIGGMVQKRLATEGNVFQAGDSLFELVNLDPITFNAEIPANVASYVDKNSAAKAHPASAPEQAQEGVVFYISPEIDTLNKTIEVRIHLPNPSGAIKEGQEGEATVQTSKIDKVLMLPPSSIVNLNDQSAIFVIQAGKVFLTPVEIGQKVSDSEWEVRANLRVDDPIVVSPPADMVDGSHVKIVE